MGFYGRKNDEFIRKYLKLATISKVIFVIILVFIILSGGWKNTTIAIIAITLLVSTIWGEIYVKRIKTVLVKSLKSKESNDLIRCMTLPLKRTKQIRLSLNKNIADVLEYSIAYNNALGHCLYGEFDKALESIQQVDWDKAAPITQGDEIRIRSLINYLKPGNYREGLSQSYSVKELSETSQKYKGAELTQRVNDIYIVIGEILTGDISGERISKLEQEYEVQELLIKLIIAWCMANAYLKLGDTEKSQHYSAYIKEKAPYCTPLHRIDESVIM